MRCILIRLKLYPLTVTRAISNDFGGYFGKGIKNDIQKQSKKSLDKLNEEEGGGEFPDRRTYACNEHERSFGALRQPAK